MQIKEIYRDGVLVEKQVFKKNKGVFQLITLGLMLLSVFVMVGSDAVIKHYSLELPCWFWITEAVAPLASVALFAVYEIIRE